MQILSPEQIKAWDAFTIQYEPIASIDLMERAAQRCVTWIIKQGWSARKFYIFCGKGNNGGDGLAIGRQLLAKGYRVGIYILEFGKLGSEDFQKNLQRLQALPAVDLHFLQTEQMFPAMSSDDVVIDALFGTGLDRPLCGLSAELVHHLNQSASTLVSIDVPSGMYINRSSNDQPVIKAAYTLTFQCQKLAFLLQENAPFVGEVQVLDIGLHPGFLQQFSKAPEFLDEKMIRRLYRRRNRFAHKGTFGHALLVGGSYGKIGAMVLATLACLRTGAGLTTVFVPRCGYAILQTTAPEAMVMVDSNDDYLTELPDEIEKFTAIGVGPGMGTQPETLKLLSFLVRRFPKPLVLDADALNCLSQSRNLLDQLPPLSILTPHPKEFDRLFGEHSSDFDRIQTATQQAEQKGVIIVLKGHHSFIVSPDGRQFFNSTGNAGMAKGGSGDVLTGNITALLAQGYQPLESATLGVYLHGWAGDMAAKRLSQETMLPSDLIDSLSNVFQALADSKNG